jgi:hypothetical protein
MNRLRRHIGGVAGAAALSVVAISLAPAEPPEAPRDDPAASSAREATLPEVAVQLKGGQRITGLLVSADDQAVVVRVAGINTRLPMDTVERYDVLPPILERYEELRKTIGDDPDDIVRLAEWLQAREQYPLALTEVNRALEIERTNAKALRLKSILEQLIVLRTRPKNAEGAPPARSAETADPARREPAAFPLLSPADVNLIKVFEVDLAQRPRVLIKRETIERMMAQYAGHPLIPVTAEGREALLRRPPLEQLDLMFRLQAREFYREVEILETPDSIKKFRDDVQRTWLMGCATNQCHGGLEAGRLVLHNRHPGSDASVFTNLLILSRFRTTLGPRSGSAEGADPASPPGRPLIDWDHPERSPLLHVGLPRKDSLFPHPIVPRPASAGGGGDIWRPAFSSTEDRLFKKTLDWISAMYRPRPDYPVSYTPLRPFVPPRAPGGAATTAEPTPR